MRKCLVTLAIGERHAQIELLSRPFREHYAKVHGYEYRVITSIAEFAAKHELPPDLYPPGKEELTFRGATLLKLLIPKLLTDFDYAVFMDADSVVNPKAPCLSIHEPAMVKGGFAAAQSVTNDEARQFFPFWPADYYFGMEQKGFKEATPLRDSYINSGLLTFRPREVADSWPSLREKNSEMHEENLLNGYEVQAGRCHLLPRQWNLIWYYRKHVIGWLKPQSSRVRIELNRIKNKLGIGEKWMANKCFEGCHLMHFAFEAPKMGYLEPERWLK